VVQLVKLERTVFLELNSLLDY